MSKLPTFGKEKEILNVIIETPRGCRNKYAYDPELKLFKLKKTLPMGADFPFDFGFIPRTKGQDGDPLDVLVMIDEPAFPGCLVECHLLGVLKAEQTENKKTIRNDRLIAVEKNSVLYSDKKSVRDIDQNILKQIEHFFISYNEISNRHFQPLEWLGPKKAMQLIMDAIE